MTAEDAKEACEKGAIPATKTACKDGGTPHFWFIK